MQGLDGLVQTIKNALAKAEYSTGAVQGTIQGDYVNISNTLYAYDCVVDMIIDDGCVVWCVFNEAKTRVIVVGAS